MQMTNDQIHPQTIIGHVHLKVSDLKRSVDFYSQVLGFQITTRLGNNAAFLSAGGYHHHIGLNTWESKNGSPPPPNSTGLYHFAILLPSRRELARCVKRLQDQEWPIDGASDHGVSEAIYLRDPDDNGIELYWDREKKDWPTGPDGKLVMYTHPLDMRGLMATLENQDN